MSVLLNSPDVSEQVFQERHPQSYLDSHGHTNDLKESSSRPAFHLTAPNGWLNDPCGLGYDPATGLYHLFFQWNPYGNDWGNMSWGHATSPDLVTWERSSTPALAPTAEYDKCGVFTGCLRATDVHGNPGALTAIYTSVSHLPIHFTLPYTTGCESLSLAVSNDGGESWKRQDCNPILPGPPENLPVTGWRDPCLTTWTRKRSSLARSSQSQLHGFISGGIKGQNPAVFVYTVNPNDIRQWNYIGPLVDVGLNFRPSRWSGDFGVNWEVANFTTLRDDLNESRDFIIMGVEGCIPAEKSAPNAGEARQRRDPRGQMWMSVTSAGIDDSTSDALTKFASGGFFDHGCLYAANSFWDPETSQRIVYGWVTEEDLPDGPRHHQGWSGMISVPRVVNLMTLRNVTKARHSSLNTITSIEAIDLFDGNGYTVHTLGISPDSRLSRLRKEAKHHRITNASLSTPSLSTAASLPLTTARWELQSEFSVSQSCKSVGIEIAHSADFEDRTILTWDSTSETFMIDRPLVKDAKINHGRESAPHTLFTYMHGQQETEETLKIHAFFDRSVLEVFVNNRTAITTRIYHPSDRSFGVRFFAEPIVEGLENPSTTLLQADVWDGIGTCA
ncbi:Glycoside hydrolase family 32 [Penicillium angulare]|uniref:Glycoside hydrolase family 32 n=1 Tax=Penicillium angulare TaxID=116970 RepID=A0A9W9FW81_9EURO|nr:Glycoside hydrolase family 32 [Penicillium angulare]